MLTKSIPPGICKNKYDFERMFRYIISKIQTLHILHILWWRLPSGRQLGPTHRKVSFHSQLQQDTRSPWVCTFSFAFFFFFFLYFLKSTFLCEFYLVKMLLPQQHLIWNAVLLSSQPKWAKCFSKFPWTPGNQAGFKVHAGVWGLGAVSGVLRGAGLSPVLRATVHVLLHCRLVVIQLLTGEVVQLKKPTGLYDHVGTGVTRNSILGNGLEEKMRESMLTWRKVAENAPPPLPEIGTENRKLAWARQLPHRALC